MYYSEAQKIYSQSNGTSKHINTAFKQITPPENSKSLESLTWTGLSLEMVPLKEQDRMNEKRKVAYNN